MIDGVSDSPEQAQLLAKKLAGMGAHVNMIPLNNVTESGLHTSSRQAIRRFQTILEENGVTATLRRTLGMAFAISTLPAASCAANMNQTD